ncbi:MAG: hypothetical protein PUJ93_00315 [Oscillospiraceae bacterium]|nr:hypothetical protein [Oscillospiraceae bacterium]
MEKHVKADGGEFEKRNSKRITESMGKSKGFCRKQSGKNRKAESVLRAQTRPRPAFCASEKDTVFARISNGIHGLTAAVLQRERPAAAGVRLHFLPKPRYNNAA